MPGAGLNGVPLAPMLRALVGRCDFTIISNNCWGAHVYQALYVEYRTPFVGLFIPPRSYLRLVQRFDSAMAAKLTFTNRSDSDAVNAWREAAGLIYPIGLLDGDIEINFQHYASQAEVQAKWCRRVERMASDPRRRFFKFDDRESATRGDIEAFCALPLANKVCFVTAPYSGTVVAPAESGESHVMDGLTLGRISHRYFNTLRWISVLPRWVPIPSLV